MKEKINQLIEDIGDLVALLDRMDQEEDDREKGILDEELVQRGCDGL
mgnify:CR=1 FL=1